MLWDSPIYSDTLNLSEGAMNDTFRLFGSYSVNNGLDYIGGDGYDMSSPFQGDAIVLDYAAGFDYLQIAYWPYIESITYTTADPIPEPATILLIGTGIVGMIGFRRKKFQGRSAEL